MNLNKMNLYKSMKNYLQAKNRNRIALQQLKELGYPLPFIRKALIDLNDIKLSQISNGNIPLPTISTTISGSRKSGIAMIMISKSLGLDPEELFDLNLMK